MKHIHKIFLSLLVISLLLVAGCAKDDGTAQSGSSDNTTVSVSIPLQIANVDLSTVTLNSKSQDRESSENGFSIVFGEDQSVHQDQPTTKTTTTALDNVWVLQFDKAGKNVLTQHLGTLAAKAYLSVPSLVVGTDYTLCFLANGPTAAGLSTTNPATLTDFERAMLHTTTASSDLIPLSARLNKVSVVDLGSGIGKILLSDESVASIVLKRIQAEITLKVTTSVTDYNLASVQLYNVPNGASYGLKPNIASFPDNAVVANFGYTDPKSAGLAPTITTGNTYKWFIGDNRRGEVTTLTTQRDRNSTKAPAYATFARITLAHNTYTFQKIYYDIYLGLGTLTNFDLKRNHSYTATASIKGTAEFQEALIGLDGRVSGVGIPIYITESKADSPFILLDNISDPYGLTWEESTNHCASLAPAGTWRIPSTKELMTVWNYYDAVPKAHRPVINYWTSDESENDATKSWYVQFGSGCVITLEKSNRGLATRCVRDNPALGASWKYPKLDTDPRTIVSREGAEGLKMDALLTPTQKVFIMNPVSVPIYDQGSEYNKVSPKFQVAKENCTASNPLAVVQTGNRYIWVNAYLACKGYSEVGALAGIWRLPTQRELMLMWILKDKLQAGPGFTAFSLDAYWTSTGNNTLAGSACYMGFNTNFSHVEYKTIEIATRCVRDL